MRGSAFLKIHITDTTNTWLATSMYGKNKFTTERRPARARNEKINMQISSFCHSIAHVEHTRAGAQEMADLRPLVARHSGSDFLLGGGRENESGGGGDHIWTAYN